MFHHRLTRSIPTILSHIPKATHRLPITHHLITSHIQRRISARLFSSDDSSSSSKKPTTPPKIEEKEKDKDKETAPTTTTTKTPTTSKDATVVASEKDATENKTENKTDEKTEIKEDKTDASVIIDGEMSSDVNAVMAQIVLTQRANKANDVDKPRAPTPPELPLIPVHERPLFPGHQYTLWVNDPVLMEQITRLYNLNRPYFAVHYRQDKGDTVHLKPTSTTTTTTTTTTPETTPPDETSELVPPTPATNVKSPAQIAKEQQDEALMAEAKAREQRKRKKDKKLLANKYKDEIRTVPITSLKQLYPMGVMVHISRIAHTPHGINLTVFAHRRIRITELIETSPITRVSVIHIDEDPSQSAMPQSLRIISSSETPTPEEQRTRAELERIISLRRAYRQNIFMSIRELVNRKHIYVESLAAMFSVIEWDNLGKIADSVTTLMSGLADPHKQQAILSEMDILKRIDKAYEIIQRELKILELQEKIHKEVESKVQDQNKKHILMQQLHAIKKELGQNKDKALVGKFKARLKGKDVPEPIMRVIKDEMTKLKTLSPQASEFNVVRNYLDWLTILPWGVYTPENYDLKHAEQILDEDHYGLQDVKERILEFIAVGKLKGKVEQGKILTLVGPPGVGKTSIGKSIARALNRKFFRFSVGGTDDVAEVKGHRRTYVGALPGKIITCMKQTECMNPVILIDEIDKMGRSHHGDPSSALLEVLDPAQNGSFVDHFMDVPIDLSKVLFICTANVRDRIPGPLADRMDFITISGYVWKEQLQIVKKYLEPLERKRTGITESQATIDDSAYKSLIRWYCREAGVRNLQKHVERIYRKIALRIARDDHTVVNVNENNLSEFVGKPRFISDRMYDITPPGVVMGLAWNSMGGATLYIESAVADHLHIPQSPKREKKEKKSEDEKDKKLPEEETPVTTTAVIPRKKGVSGGLFCTGQMGDVMRESTQIAYTVAKAQLARIKPSSSFFRRHRIHMHVPHGAIPKDGPSAGITMVTSLLSLALHRSVRSDVAMTGELTLTGRVLPIGGVKEKVIAARRSNAPILIFPMENRKDWDELADYIKDGITVHFVDHYEQVFDIAFNGVPSTSTSKVTTTAAPVVTDATPPASLLDY